MNTIVLSGTVTTAKDGRRFGRLTIATTPSSPDVRGLMPVELDADPDVVTVMPSFPALYDIHLELRAVSSGFVDGNGRYQRGANTPRQFVTAAKLIAPIAPVREAAK